MSLSKIKKCLKEVRNNEDALYWCETEFVNLLMAVAEHVLNLGKEHEETTTDDTPKNFMRVAEFVKKYKFFSGATIYNYCNHHPDFSSKCAKRSGSQWYIDPELAYEYLKNLPVFKKRLERLSGN